MYSSSHLSLLLLPPCLHFSCECILDLTCLFGCTLIFFAQLPFGFCSSSATDFWSELPPTFPASLPPSPVSYVLSCRINISDPQLHSSTVKVCIWVFLPYVPFGTVAAVEGGRPFTQEYSLLVQSPAGESIKRLQYVDKGARPASSATCLSLPFIAH